MNTVQFETSVLTWQADGSSSSVTFDLVKLGLISGTTNLIFASVTSAIAGQIYNDSGQTTTVTGCTVSGSKATVTFSGVLANPPLGGGTTYPMQFLVNIATQ